MSDKRDDIYKALADRHRRQILAELCLGSRRAGELARQVGLAPNAVSFHLRWLRSAGLVDVEREGRFLWYRVEPATVATWQAQVRRQFQISPGEVGRQEKAGVQTPERRSTRHAPKHGIRRKRDAHPASRLSGPRQARSENIAIDTLPTELL